MNILFSSFIEALSPYISPLFFMIMIVLLLFQYLPKSPFTVTKNTFLTLGTLGTFLGIALGLYNFDTNNIDSSIPTLLEGLKTAFLTSIYGIICSFFCPPPKKENIPDDIPTLLTKIHQSLQDFSNNSLLIEVQQTRKEMKDCNTLLRNDLRDFANAVSKSSTEAIVKALQDVVHNFNGKITSQFGENFKHLNQGVEKLLLWQEQYKLYIEATQTQLTAVILLLEGGATHLEHIHTATKLLPSTIEDISTLTQVQSTHIQTLEERLKAFAEMKEHATEAMPFIQQRLTELTEKLSTSLEHVVKKTEENMKKAFDASEQFIQNSTTQNEKVLTSVHDITEETKVHIKQSSKEIEELMNSVFREYDEKLQKQITGILTNIAEELGGIAQHLVDAILPKKGR